MNEKIVAFILVTLMFPVNPIVSPKEKIIERNEIARSVDSFSIQWQKSYGRLPWWSARYEGPQPVGDCDDDGKNELLIGGRDPFLRVMEYDESRKTYYEAVRIIDPVFGIGYSFMGIPEPFGSATGFSIADIDNDGKNEIGVAWGRHFSAFKWNGHSYEKIGMYVVYSGNGRKWATTLDCIVGDVDNDGENEVVITGGYPDAPEVLVLKWDGKEFVKVAEWDYPGNYWVYFPWIADVDNDGKNELLCNTNVTIALQWNGDGWDEEIIARHNRSYPFGCVAKDSDNDGKPEIHVTFGIPMLKIYEYENGSYVEKASFCWEGEDGTIEAIDVGDVDYDGIAEIAAGTNYVHILQWNGEEYEEEYIITDTHGLLAVTCIGDMDNDGKNEIHASSVGVSWPGEEYEAWIFKYGWEK